MTHDDHEKPQARPEDGLASELARALHDDRRSPPALSPLLSQLHAQLDASDNSRRARLRAWPTRSRLWLLWSSVLLVAAVTLVAAPRPDLAAHPAARMALVLVALLGMCAPLLPLALGSWHRPVLGKARAAAYVVAALATSVVLAVLPEAHIMLPLTAARPGAELAHALDCLGFGLACGLPIFAICKLLSRGAPYATLLATAVAGVTGNIALQLHCPVTQSVHLLAGHSTVGLLALVLAVPFASTKLRNKSRPAA